MYKNNFPFISNFGLTLILVIIMTTILSNQSAFGVVNKLGLTKLRVEYKSNPIGIDNLKPRLNWEIVSDERGVKQRAYQIQTGLDIEHLKSGKNLFWDSGKIKSDQSVHIEYSGPPLQSRQRVYWRVKIWDQDNKNSDWSEISFWEMGLLKESDWQTFWIEPTIEEDKIKSQPCPMLRKEFSLKKPIKSARLYVTSHGLYETHLNGQKVGEQVFTPGWTSYNKRLQYQTYDITKNLRKGNNAIGVILGDGWYRGTIGWAHQRNYYGEKLRLLLLLHVDYQDGSSEVVTSDQTWKTETGPILESDIYHGEIYDAQLEKTGWTKVGFKDQDWKSVKIVNQDKKILVSSFGPPVRKIQEISPIKIIKTPAGETVFDFGQNMVGWVRINVKGQAGEKVILKHAEVLDKEGNFYTGNLRTAKQRIEYILNGKGEEVFEPHFTFQGFRYVLVEKFPGEPKLENLTGIVIHSDMTPTGTFVCSDSLINQLQHNIQWGLKGNFLDVPTDCPQRDERMGWTGDAQVFARTASFNMDAASFYIKWLQDLAADQFKNGAVTHVVPDVLKGAASAAWADASVIVPWTVYLCYGDKRILENQYESMKAWIEYMRNKAGDNYLWQNGNHFGDWLAFATTRSDYPGATTAKDLIATAYFAHSTNLLKKTAEILGKSEDIHNYNNLYKNIKTAFQKEYVTPNGRITSDTQTAYALALTFDLLPESLIKIVAKRFSEDVKQFKHITTGFVGASLVNPVLAENGYLDLAYMLLNRKDYPSWLYPITKGATTIWERWDGIKPDGSFQDEGMNSFNHYAYGAIGDWLYRVVAGIEIDEINPGYKHFIIHPHPGGGLSFASANYHSMYGDIESSWKISNKNFELAVSVPPNTTATIKLPFAKVENVLEGQKLLEISKGIFDVVQKEDLVILNVGSGNYNFKYNWKADLK